ncbi:ORF49 [Felid gammaherpesvirus 1]|uniref:ORF49 n=1 Tax=Felid gammaherpesvirus 1 TaxID=2560468 RepID=A0A0M4LR31_9GAMA|nr:ORF49 [Felis catus gammaherpesvirus 1]ALE14761.1 ORF49 [Felis catus gammaherpesvirus 1]
MNRKKTLHKTPPQLENYFIAPKCMILDKYTLKKCDFIYILKIYKILLNNRITSYKIIPDIFTVLKKATVHLATYTRNLHFKLKLLDLQQKCTDIQELTRLLPYILQNLKQDHGQCIYNLFVNIYPCLKWYKSALIGLKPCIKEEVIQILKCDENVYCLSYLKKICKRLVCNTNNYIQSDLLLDLTFSIAFNQTVFWIAVAKLYEKTLNDELLDEQITEIYSLLNFGIRRFMNTFVSPLNHTTTLRDIENLICYLENMHNKIIK